MTRNELIKIIHVAKRNLGLRDEDYRALLAGATGKESCKEMSDAQLKLTYQAMTAIGFKHRGGRKVVTKAAERRPAPRANTSEKIIAVWVTMGQHGFISDSSRPALDAYVTRMTKPLNGGVGVASVAWLTEALASRVLEALKRWHMRVMCDEITQRGHSPKVGYERIKEQFEQQRPR